MKSQNHIKLINNVANLATFLKSLNSAEVRGVS